MFSDILLPSRSEETGILMVTEEEGSYAWMIQHGCSTQPGHSAIQEGRGSIIDQLKYVKLITILYWKGHHLELGFVKSGIHIHTLDLHPKKIPFLHSYLCPMYPDPSSKSQHLWYFFSQGSNSEAQWVLWLRLSYSCFNVLTSLGHSRSWFLWNTFCLYTLSTTSLTLHHLLISSHWR